MRKPTKQSTRLAKARTEYGRWRAMLGLTHEDAGALLGISERQSQNYEAGAATPDYAMRIVMRDLIDGRKLPDPWPE